MTTLGKITILAIGYFLMLPVGFCLMSNNVWIILCGIVYLLTIIFVGDEKDRKFWRVWYGIHCKLCHPWTEYESTKYESSEYDESTTNEVR